jgi:hypothetical protein
MDQLPTHHVSYVDVPAGIYYDADLILSDDFIAKISAMKPDEVSVRRFKNLFRQALYTDNTEEWKRNHMDITLDFDKFSKPHAIPRP